MKDSPISRMSWNRGPGPEEEEDEDKEDEEEGEEESLLSSSCSPPSAPLPRQYSRIREWIPSRSLACAAAGSLKLGSGSFRKVRIAMLAVAASTSLAASQHRLPSSYAWKGCV